MRMLILSNLYPPHILGGYEILCAQVCERLRRRGHEVHVQTTRHGLRDDEPVEMADHPSAVAVYRELDLFVPFGQPPAFLANTRHRTSRRNAELTRRRLEQLNPDLVFAWSQLRLTLGSVRAAQHAGFPVAWTFNDENIHSYHGGRPSLRPRGFARWAAGRFVYPEITLKGLNFDHCTTISSQVKSNLLRRGVPVDAARVIFQGIPTESFPHKQEPGSIGSPLRVLYAGQLHAYKGVHTLLKAAEDYAGRNGENSIQLTIAGDGDAPYREKLQAMAESGRFPVRFTGRVDQKALARLYREHHVFVFPSIWQEPFGLTHLEAMASGTPVISTADGGHGEFLRHEVNALVFEKKNHRELCAHLERLVRDENLARRLAANARQEIEEIFTLDAYVNRLEPFLESALKGAVR